MISCGARLAPFDIPQLREVMAYDELELDRIGDRKTAVFFIISDTTQTYNFLVALAFSQMFNLLCERADNVHGGRLPHHVRVLWDEAANTGQVPQLEKLVAVIRSREVSLCLLYQQLAQCKAIYDKHAETILGNMDSVVFLGGREASTIKEISENWLGKATISMQTDSRSRGQSESYSQNTQRLGRELMTPAELATMPGDKCILQLRGLPPFFSPNLAMLRYEWIWYKERGTGFLNANRAPLKKSENILVFYQKSPVYNPQFTYGKPYARVHSRSGTSSNYGKFERQGSESNDGRRYPGNVLFVPTVSGGIHPTQKPVELCEYLIRTYTRPGELVADICAGSGTTAIAAINTERRFVCFETAPAFYAAASERIRAAQAVKSSGEKGV